MIELDRSEAWEPPERPALSRRLSVRWVAAVAAVVVLLAVLAGAEPVVRPAPPVLLPGDGVNDLRVDGDTLYMLRRLDPARTLAESYRISDGRLLWSRFVEAHPQFVAVGSGRVVLTGLRPGEATTHTLTALDSASGSPVWSRPDHAPSFYGSAGDVVVAEPYREGAEPGRLRGQLIGLDMVTGDIRWSLPRPEGVVRSFVSDISGTRPGPVLLAEVGPDALRLRSTETGAVVKTVALDRPDTVDGFDVAGNRLLAYRFGDRDVGQRGMRNVSVFDLGTGARVWERSVDPGDDPRWFWWCGRILCAGAETATTALDPGTGRELWHLDGWTNLLRLGDDRILATRSAPTGEPRPGVIVIDAATGAVVRRVDTWELVTLEAFPAVLVSGRTPTGTVRLARFNVDTGGLTVFGRSDRWAVPPHCVTTAVVLACAHGPAVSVWRIPGAGGGGFFAGPTVSRAPRPGRR